MNKSRGSNQFNMVIAPAFISGFLFRLTAEHPLPDVY